MVITKKESKNLRYFARANYKSECKGVETENGKMKHREFPCFELSYDESKSADGLVELTNVTIGGKPFEGDYSALMTRLREILDNPDILGAEELEQDKTLTEQAVDAVQGKPDEVVTSENPGDILKATLKEIYPEGTKIDVDIKPQENRVDVKVVPPVHSVEMQIKVEPVKDPQEPEKKTIEVTGAVVPERHDSGRDFSVLSLEPKDEAPASAAGEDIAKQEPPPLEEPQELPVVEKVEEAKKMAEETGKPVVTAVQKPKKTRAELYDLQIKCATMKLATSYKEPPDTDIGWLMKKYPDAVEKLNALYAADGIKTYTITEEAIKKAYPDEYAVLCP